MPVSPAGTARPNRKAVVDTVFLLVALSVLIVVTSGSTMAMDSDIWWHLRIGHWILANRTVPVRDLFSSHAMGQPWSAYSWLFEVLVSGIFDVWGDHGILVLTIFATLAYTAWLTVFLARFTNLRRAMILAFSAYLAVMPLKSPRPWLFTILFFTVELSLLWRARESNRPALLLPIVPLFVVWANLHIQFIYGLGLIGLFALEGALPDRARRALSAEPAPVLRSVWLWTLLAGSCLATLLNPYGWNIYRIVAQYANQSASLIYVQEGQSMPFRSLSNWIALLLIGSAIFVVGCARSKNILLIALLAVSCFFGFRMQRDIWFPVTVAVVAVASGVRMPAGGQSGRSRCNYWIAIPLSFAITLLFLALDSRFSDNALHKNVAQRFPEKASGYIESHGLQGPLFNSYNWGGYLMWRLPGMPVSIDGRGVIFENYLATAANTVNGQKNWSRDPDLRKAHTIVLEQDFALTAILRVDPNYRLLYEDETAAVFQPR